MRFFIRMLISFLLMGWGQFVFAQEYSWYTNNINVTFPTPLLACKSYNVNITTVVIRTDGTRASCRFPDLSIGGTVYRQGTTCLLPSVYNPSTGACEAPPPDECEAKKDQSTTFTKSGTAPDSYAVVLPGGTLGQETSACFSSCVVSTSDQKCVVNPVGNYTCQGIAYYTGQKCTTGPEVDHTDSPKEPEPDTITKDKPCQYIEQADGTLRCDSEKSTEKEGQSCGTVNGVKKCFDTKPTKDGLEIETVVKTQTKPDGSSTTTKTDTATKTTCSGINSCTTTTTTTTTTTEKDADGNVNSVSGICTGAACPDKTNPDGDGDGFGDCTGDDCGGGEGGSLNIGELPEFGDDTPTYGETMSAFVDKVQTIGFIAAARNISIPNGGGSCSVQPINIFGSSVSVDSFCEFVPLILQPLSYLFLALWGWIAIRIILSA